MNIQICNMHLLNILLLAYIYSLENPKPPPVVVVCFNLLSLTPYRIIIIN